MFGDHGLCGLPEEGAYEKSPKCLGGNLGDFGEFWGILGNFAKVSNSILKGNRDTDIEPHLLLPNNLVFRTISNLLDIVFQSYFFI